MTPNVSLLRTSLLGSGVANWYSPAPPVPTTNWRIPFGSAAPAGLCGAKRS